MGDGDPRIGSTPPVAFHCRGDMGVYGIAELRFFQAVFRGF